MNRLDSYPVIAAALAGLGDDALSDRLDQARPLGDGIGGRSALLSVEGRSVFVKQVRLTDLENQPGNVMETANLFDLPLYCQYRVGSPGFGVWREVAAHVMATEWVLSGQCANFPLMYHWRIIRGIGPMSAEQAAELEQSVRVWGESDAVRRRLQALHEAQASVALFLEYVPSNLNHWLGGVVVAGGPAAETAVRHVDEQIKATSAFMASQGLIHFDLHFDNVLTDGNSLYVTDFGLALSSRFNLSAAEMAFLDEHRCYDQCNAALSFVICFVRSILGSGPWEERFRERGNADGAERWAPTAAAAIIRRDASTALALKAFFLSLADNKAAPFPAARLERLLAETGKG